MKVPPLAGHLGSVLNVLYAPTAQPAPRALDVATLFDAHGAWVHQAAQRLTASPGAADDVVQEVFLLAHRRRAELDERLGIRTWLYRATVNVARQQRRSDRRYGSILDRFRSEPVREQPGPDADLARRQSGLQIHAAVASLSDVQREVFVLFELEHLDGAEIAVILDIPINTVWSRLRLARVTFKDAWTTLAGGTP